MATKNRTIKVLAAGLALALGLMSDGDLVGLTQGGGFSGAQAVVVRRPVVVRPARPVSAAGVARRTTRRVVRRTATYVSVLPAGCVTTHVGGVAVWHCGAHYYERYGGHYVLVRIE
jgi:hypothetical protein